MRNFRSNSLWRVSEKYVQYIREIKRRLDPEVRLPKQNVNTVYHRTWSHNSQIRSEEQNRYTRGRRSRPETSEEWSVDKVYILFNIGLGDKTLKFPLKSKVEIFEDIDLDKKIPRYGLLNRESWEVANSDPPWWITWSIGKCKINKRKLYCRNWL